MYKNLLIPQYKVFQQYQYIKGSVVGIDVYQADSISRIGPILVWEDQKVLELNRSREEQAAQVF